MPTMTIAEFKKRTRDQLIAGIVGDVYTTNPVYEFIPWTSYRGSGISVNREDTIGDAQFLAVGGTITAKAASGVTQILFESTKVIGDAEIDSKLIVESGSDINDVVATELSSKAKAVGRLIQQGIATGDGASPNMNSLHSMVDSGQYVTQTAGGVVLGYDALDEVLDKVKSKDGTVEWMMMHGREIRAFRALERTSGGLRPMDIQMGGKTIQIQQYNGIPIFQNDWLSITETDDGAALTGGALSSVYCGVWDEGDKKTGLSMIYPEASELGFSVTNIGQAETRDETIYRVRALCNLALFNRRGVARLTGVKV